MDFADIVPVSALKGSNKAELIDVIFKYLPYGPMSVTNTHLDVYKRQTMTSEIHRRTNKFIRIIPWTISVRKR